MTKFDSVLLFSGGLDSFVAYYYLDKKAQPIYYPLNSRYTQKELKHINYLQKQGINILIDNSLFYLGALESGNKAYIPYRNLHLALHAATFYSNKIYIAGLKDDNVIDKNERIFSIWSNTLSETNGEQVQILSPFWNMTKRDVAIWYADKYSALDLDKGTLSCYSPIPDKHCYSCPACFRRNVALYQVGIRLPFFNKEIIQVYKNKIGKELYNVDREKYMVEYINFLEK